ncbi:MAG: Glycosyl transferase, group 1 family protein [uncultured Thermomicrobiales bacterium]|uniref:Glycosyl transferase, group 1 family protein n=1 Tax=uncultured Thermomicrobiales bacterium TaxID=1645740 RepID=A0A6J4VQS5_9BACT|nr:MAG: Glycosyl transferase, group 1 family protein [uncultured Thermomicrobiales bacterium]
MSGNRTRYRILFLTPQRPNRTRQVAAIRNWNLIAHLAQRHEIDLLTFGEPVSDERTRPGGPDEPWRTIVTVPAPRRTWQRRLRVLTLSGRADMADRLWSPPFVARLRQLLREGEYDIVQGEGIEMARYLLLVRTALGERPAPLLVFDDHNAEYVLQRRAAATDVREVRHWPRAVYSVFQWQRLRAFERRALRECDLTVCVSEADAAALQALAPERPLVVAPNGVDTGYYARARVADRATPRFDLAFSGTLDYRPNIDAVGWFVEEVWPRLRARRPGRSLRLALIGRNPAPEVTRLVLRDGVVVTGSVADDRPYFAGATVYILPMRYGGGVRLKLLNALAMGCAVVATRAGCEGVPVRDDEHLLLADDAEAFAAAAERLLDDADLRARLGAAGRAMVERDYDWGTIVARLEGGYEAAFAIRDSPQAADRPLDRLESEPDAPPGSAASDEAHAISPEDS